MTVLGFLFKELELYHFIYTCSLYTFSMGKTLFNITRNWIILVQLFSKHIHMEYLKYLYVVTFQQNIEYQKCVPRITIYWFFVVFQRNIEYQKFVKIILTCQKFVSRNTIISMCCGDSAEYRISEICFKKHNNIDVLWCFSGI